MAGDPGARGVRHGRGNDADSRDGGNLPKRKINRFRCRRIAVPRHPPKVNKAMPNRTIWAVCPITGGRA
ncbi:hypothetical protein PVAP13_6KG253906 [Panicum virgatum]|uniref:Uncharacterized protein n=1 Tax=Panicum virgatum TaxID=38727 RepID=A0A8T0RFT9_PANVG|nr:hypothetical protein PVAP13_6KG253906 [Panicum virgatum]